MQQQNQPNAMRRKAGAGRPPPEFGVLSPAKALRDAIAQAAQEVIGLAAIAADAEVARVMLEPACASLPDPALLALIEGPGGRFGLAVLDMQAVAAVIEIQTTGRVVPRPAEPRAPTRTDAIMCADFIDRTLEDLERRIGEAGLELAPAVTGYRYAMALPEARTVAMTLDDIPYRQLRANVDFGHGGKSGMIAFLLPHDPPARSGGNGRDTGAFTLALQTRVMETQAVLRATLLRRDMTLAEVTRLQAGMEIEVPRDALAQVMLEGIDGRTVARGRLGQASGHRAIRLAANAAAETGAGARATTAPSPALPRAGVGEMAEPQAAAELPDPAAAIAAGAGPDALAVDLSGADGGGPSPEAPRDTAPAREAIG